MPESVVVSLVVLLFVLTVSAVGTVLVVRRERRRPSSYSRRQAARRLAAWRALPTSVQAACDDEALDAAEAEDTAAAFLRTLYRP